MSAYKVRRQKPVKGGRQMLSAGFIAALEAEIERTAKRFHVTRSFVIAVAVADSLGIEEQETFIPQPKSRARLKLVANR
jgi:hypothetical protein